MIYDMNKVRFLPYFQQGGPAVFNTDPAYNQMTRGDYSSMLRTTETPYDSGINTKVALEDLAMRQNAARISEQQNAEQLAFDREKHAALLDQQELDNTHRTYQMNKDYTETRSKLNIAPAYQPEFDKLAAEAGVLDKYDMTDPEQVAQQIQAWERVSSNPRVRAMMLNTKKAQAVDDQVTAIMSSVENAGFISPASREKFKNRGDAIAGTLGDDGQPLHNIDDYINQNANDFMDMVAIDELYKTQMANAQLTAENAKNKSQFTNDNQETLNIVEEQKINNEFKENEIKANSYDTVLTAQESVILPQLNMFMNELKDDLSNLQVLAKKYPEAYAATKLGAGKTATEDYANNAFGLARQIVDLRGTGNKQDALKANELEKTYGSLTGNGTGTTVGKKTNHSGKEVYKNDAGQLVYDGYTTEADAKGNETLVSAQINGKTYENQYLPDGMDFVTKRVGGEDTYMLAVKAGSGARYDELVEMGLIEDTRGWTEIKDIETQGIVSGYIKEGTGNEAIYYIPLDEGRRKGIEAKKEVVEKEVVEEVEAGDDVVKTDVVSDDVVSTDTTATNIVTPATSDATPRTPATQFTQGSATVDASVGESAKIDSKNPQLISYTGLPAGNVDGVVPKSKLKSNLGFYTNNWGNVKINSKTDKASSYVSWDKADDNYRHAVYSTPEEGWQANKKLFDAYLTRTTYSKNGSNYSYQINKDLDMAEFRQKYATSGTADEGADIAVRAIEYAKKYNTFIEDAVQYYDGVEDELTLEELKKLGVTGEQLLTATVKYENDKMFALAEERLRQSHEGAPVEVEVEGDYSWFNKNK